MSDAPNSIVVERLVGRLQSEGEKTVAFFRNLTLEQWQQIIYEAGSTWTIDQILAHFVSTEQAFADLITNILEDGPGAPENFDIDTYNERHVVLLKGISRGELLEQYRDARDDNIRRVQSMSPQDLARQGRHPFLGVVPLEEIVKLLYRHNQIHLRDARRALTLATG